MLATARQTSLLIFLGCTALILTALFMQHQWDMKPCPLCITQRIFIIIAGILALLAFIHNPKALGIKIYAALGMVFSTVGGGVSLRHVWLQSLPAEQVPACGPGLGYMFENFPLSDAFQLLMQGDGNCADVVWTFLGLSIPGWTAVAYAGLIGINFWQLMRRP